VQRVKPAKKRIKPAKKRIKPAKERVKPSEEESKPSGPGGEGGREKVPHPGSVFPLCSPGAKMAMGWK